LQTRMNQHYMAFFVTVPFLAIPRKREAIRLVVPCFYFWAGVLKLNREWLSGAALYGDIWFFIPATRPGACAYVFILAGAFFVGLWARNPWIFWPVFVHFLAFHVISFSVVSFFYPLLMFSILAIFPFVRLIEVQASAGFFQRWFPKGPHPLAWAWVGLF